MEKEFIPYELALRMKELGFDEPCAMYWRPEMDGSMQMWYHQDERFDDAIGSQNSDNAEWVTCTAPLYQQAFKWFRENYRLSVNIHDCLDDFEAIITQWTLGDHKVVHEFPQRVDINYPHNRFDSYEEAELSCLVKLIEIVKEESKEECCESANGFYLGTTCPKCNQPFRSVIEKPKQETLEKLLAQKLQELNNCDLHGLDEQSFQSGYSNGFVNDANWKQEKTYSEEDMNEFAWYFHTHLRQFTDDQQALDKGVYLKMWLKNKNK